MKKGNYAFLEILIKIGFVRWVILVISLNEISCTLLASAPWLEGFPSTQVLTTTRLPCVPILSHLSAPQFLDFFQFTQSFGQVFKNIEK